MNIKPLPIAIVVLLAGFSITSCASAQTTSQYRESFKKNVSEWRQANPTVHDNLLKLGEDKVTELAIPVLFDVSLQTMTNNFGDLRGGGSRMHEGLDMMAPERTPIVTPTEAVVLQLEDGPSSGLTVITAVPGNETHVYMHLHAIADIKIGDLLSVGDVIGYVGHTGNAVANAPHLHFEIHDEEGGLIDPFPRITKEFTVQEKQTYLDSLLKKPTENTDLLTYITSRYRPDAAVPSPSIKQTKTSSEVQLAPSSNVLRIGSKGSDVKALQTYLRAKKIGSGSKITPDGSFGPMTKRALSEFQKSVGLTPDGVYGAQSKAYVIAHP